MPEGNPPARLAAQYDSLAQLRETMNVMRTNQSLRGTEGFLQRTAAREKHTTWRQMKGMQLAMHEMNHPGNKPFVIGFGCSFTLMMYFYFSSRHSPGAQADSKYYQRFIKKSDEDRKK